MERSYLVLLWLLLLAVPASAQTSTAALPTSATVMILPSTGNPETVTPVAQRVTVIATTSGSNTIPNANCNLAMPAAATPPMINPGWAYFPDPFNSNRACRAAFPTGAPDGTGYRAVVLLTADTCRPDASQPAISPCPSAARGAVGDLTFDLVSTVNRPASTPRVVVQP